MCLRTSSPGKLFVLLTCAHAACLARGALVYIDNTDDSIIYTGPSWRSMNNLPGAFYNNTAAYADLSGTMVQMTFNGCSATVYGALISGGSSTSNRSSSYALDGVLKSTYWTGPPQVDSYNMPFYDTSQIACTTHTLEIRNLGTDFYFDYVQINTPDPVGPSDALVTLGRTASSTQVPTAGKASSASPAATSPGSSGASATTAVSASIPASGFNPVASSSAAHRSLSKNFGAIVGIAVGGAVALLMIGCGLFRVHRRRTAVRLGPIYGFNPLVSPTTSSAYSGSHDRRWQGSSLQTVELHTDATDSNPIPSAQRSDIRYRHDLDSHAHGLIETVAPPRMDQPTSDPGARSGTQHSVDGGVRIEGGPLLPGRTVEEADRGSIASTLPPPYQHHTS